MVNKLVYEVYRDYGYYNGEERIGIFSILENAEYVKDYYSKKYNTNEIYIREIELDLSLDMIDDREYTLEELGK